jgi:hypothetical protein
MSYLLRQLPRPRNVPGLTTLVAAAEQDDEKTSALHVINPISRAIMNSKFAHAVADRPHVAGIAKCQATDPPCDFGFRPGIPETREPHGKRPGLTNFDHM